MTAIIISASFLAFWTIGLIVKTVIDSRNWKKLKEKMQEEELAR